MMKLFTTLSLMLAVLIGSTGVSYAATNFFKCNLQLIAYDSPSINGFSTSFDISTRKVITRYQAKLGTHRIKMETIHFPSSKNWEFNGQLNDDSYNSIQEFIDAIIRNMPSIAARLDLEAIKASMAYDGFPSQKIAMDSRKIWNQILTYWSEENTLQLTVGLDGNVASVSTERTKTQLKSDEVFTKKIKQLIDKIKQLKALEELLPLVQWKTISEIISGLKIPIMKETSFYLIDTKLDNGISIKGKLGIGEEVIRAWGKFGSIKFLNKCESRATMATNDIQSRLSKLKKLEDTGLITKKEAATKRKAILDSL
jgi:hypothetical protein